MATTVNQICNHMGMEVDHLIYKFLQFTIITITFHRKYKTSLQLHQLNAHFLFINCVIERCLICMKMHGIEYFKTQRKYSIVTKLKILDEMCRFVFILFPHMKYEFQIQI